MRTGQSVRRDVVPIVIEHVRLDRHAAWTDDDAVTEPIVMRAARVVVLVASVELDHVVMNSQTLNAVYFNGSARPRRQIVIVNLGCPAVRYVTADPNCSRFTTAVNRIVIFDAGVGAVYSQASDPHALTFHVEQRAIGERAREQACAP